MEILTIKLSEIEVNKDENSRSSHRYGDLDQLAQSIKQDGQLTPVHVARLEGGKYRLVAGYRRWSAIKKLSRAENKPDYAVLAQVVAGDRATQDWVNILENIARNELSSFDMARAFAKMQDEHKWSAADISKRFGLTDKGDEVKGMSASNISNLVKSYRELSPEAREAWDKGQLTNQAVFYLKSLKDHADQNTILNQVKGKSGEALTAAINEFGDGVSVMDGGTAGGRPAGRSAKPSPKVIEAALEWANENELDVAAEVLDWVLGGHKTLDLGDDFKFSAKIAEKQREAEKEAEREAKQAEREAKKAKEKGRKTKAA